MIRYTAWDAKPMVRLSSAKITLKFYGAADSLEQLCRGVNLAVCRGVNLAVCRGGNAPCFLCPLLLPLPPGSLPHALLLVLILLRLSPIECVFDGLMDRSVWVDTVL